MTGVQTCALPISFGQHDDAQRVQAVGQRCVGRGLRQRAVGPGESVTGRTWVGEAPKGARFDRHMEFVGEDGKVKVRAITQWAIIDIASGRPIRVPPEVIAPFMG